MGPVIEMLLDTGEVPHWPRRKRIELGRCLSCEWHPEIQGHHPYCPRQEVAAS